VILAGYRKESRLTSDEPPDVPRSLLIFRVVMSSDVIDDVLPFAREVTLCDRRCLLRCWERLNINLVPAHLLDDSALERKHIALEIAVPSTVEPKDDPIMAHDNDLHDAAAGLLNRVLMWIEALRLVPLQKLSTGAVIHRDSIALSFATDLMTLEPWEEHRRAGTDRGILGFVFGKAAAGPKPPEAYSMAVGASRAIGNGEYRRAVLDAATIVEVIVRPSLEKALAEKLGVGPARVITRLIGNFSGQLRVAKELGLRIPDHIERDLLHVRNATIHANHPPSAEQAEKAVHICHEALRVLQPLRP
jgi:hypothetical protein